MNQHFKTGEEVVALISGDADRSQPIIKGQKYIVLDIEYCIKCGRQAINVVGHHNYPPFINSVCHCNNRQPTRGLWWICSSSFMRPSDLESKLEEAVQQEEYETAALLRDLNK